MSPAEIDAAASRLLLSAEDYTAATCSVLCADVVAVLLHRDALQKQLAEFELRAPWLAAALNALPPVGTP